MDWLSNIFSHCVLGIINEFSRPNGWDRSTLGHLERRSPEHMQNIHKKKSTEEKIDEEWRKRLLCQLKPITNVRKSSAYISAWHTERTRRDTLEGRMNQHQEKSRIQFLLSQTGPLHNTQGQQRIKRMPCSKLLAIFRGHPQNRGISRRLPWIWCSPQLYGMATRQLPCFHSFTVNYPGVLYTL